MTTSNTKLAYYNGWWWRTTLLADGTRSVQPFRPARQRATTAGLAELTAEFPENKDATSPSPKQERR